MPIGDRDYYRGEHPPACTCADCVRSRLETGHSRYGARPKRRRWKKLLLGGAVVLTLIVSVSVTLVLTTEFGRDAYDNVAARVSETADSVLGRGSDESPDVAARDEVKAAPVDTNCRTTPATRDQDGEYVHDSINVIEADYNLSRNLVNISGSVIDRCREIWSLESPGSYGIFAVYGYPEPSCPALAECPVEEPIGGIMEPLQEGWFYPELDPHDVVAEEWSVEEDGFSITFEPAPRWGETFRLGVWGWDVGSARPGLLGEIVVRTR
ncbi:MAG: hypothetical protein OYI31_07230 [Chloroflexota bacterium]|nr:hypothetical protein [Chloroflexota bacterium]MDE2941012.1 hypothetical protein [Chloroflexota bacterium]MDE3268220.1 hypothetical protein [Chloroflexota bacterium]